SIAALSSPASAADGTITITGTVQAATCTVSNGGAVAVALPTVSTSALSTSGTVAGTKAFQIGLTACTVGPATAYFEAGPNIDTTTGRLKNNGTATNVQVQLLNSAGNAINLAGASGSQNGTSITLVAGANNLNYSAQYYATGAATAGSVTTSVVYTMQYL
ncbi:MAG: fimbrial protein, partial [Moraxellaceae bacterium]|nr:fimbrial protein [Moraxellaceae bacterium]